MNVSGAVDTRMSCRAYLPAPVPEAIVRARLRQFARNDDFFGAPVGLFFFIDRGTGPPQWADLGMFMQSVMLLAREAGLDTCPREAWSVWHRSVSEFLQVPPRFMLFAGMAPGVRDDAAPVNRPRTDRAALEEIATLRGF